MNQKDFPLDIKISFEKLFEKYRATQNTGNALVDARAAKVLEIAEAYPALSEGLRTQADIDEHQEQIDLVLEDLFASVLQTNEIKFASVPFQQNIFKTTERFDKILAVVGKDFDLSLADFDEDLMYIMGCSIILNRYYGYKTDFRRPFYYDIPDAQGILRHYRLMYNGDYIDIHKKEETKEITKEDVAELLDNFDNVALWKEKFPPRSWAFKGFVIANMYDATTDVSLSDFKANLLQKDEKDENFVTEFQTIIRAIFNLPDITVGYAIHDPEDDSLEAPPAMMNVNSYVLNGLKSESCHDSFCSSSYKHLMKDNKPYSISDVERYYNMYPDNVLYRKLYEQGIRSAIISPLVTENEVCGIMEVVSPNAQDLNSINANKLEDIMPFLIDSVKRSKERMESQMELLIQDECTSIHPSVHWKFKKEAKRVLDAQMNGEETVFEEIVFDNVYPLFGQTDIKGSSNARNHATQQDLILQLKNVKKIIRKVNKLESLPIYEQLEFRINNFLSDIEDGMHVDSERKVLNFMSEEIIPLYDHLRLKSADLKREIDHYYELLDADKGFIYKHRKDYDDSVMEINKSLAAILDKKQKEAQVMYPHYYERFKTDGVEHNLYIGESITKEEGFNKVYLFNLRLWQLQAMCEMENSFYQLKESLPVPLDVASMILVFNSSLALRFRMDEKRFDVDGTYNARYEVVKKRVDKANIKGTTERITQPGKIAIVYSQRSDEIEFMRYVKFLQSKKYLGEEVEILELEDLQGVTGLKAIRVNVLYNRGSKDKEYYTYEDLMKEISN